MSIEGILHCCALPDRERVVAWRFNTCWFSTLLYGDISCWRKLSSYRMGGQTRVIVQ